MGMWNMFQLSLIILIREGDKIIEVGQPDCPRWNKAKGGWLQDLWHWGTEGVNANAEEAAAEPGQNN